MQTRRVLLLFAVGLLLATAAASLVPVPQDAGQTEGEEPAPTTEEAGSPDDEPTQVRLSATGDADDEPPAGGEDGQSPSAGGERPPGGEDGASGSGEADTAQRPTETVPSGERVIVRVSAREPGQASIEGLGLIEAVGPRTPAVFDLFTDRPGEFDVLYTPIGGQERRLGTLAITEDGTTSDDR